MEPNIETNTEVPSGNSLEVFFEKNWKTLSCIIIALILILGFFFFSKALQQSKLQNNGEELVSASLSTDSPITKLEKIATEKEGTITGGNALLLIANKHLDNNPPNLEKAKTTLQRFSSNYKDSPLYYDGLFALATLHEELGNNVEAITIYKEIIGNSTSPASEIRLADSLYKDGKYQEAKNAYGEIRSSVFSRIASLKLSSTTEKIAVTENPPPEPEPEPEPKVEEPAPKTEEPAPKTEEPAPKAEEPAPKAEEPAPK